MIPRNRITMASFIVGGVGGVIAGLWGYFWVSQGIGIPEYTIAIGIFSGFLSCFLVSMWYLRFMEYKGWQWGILCGPLFGGLAGIISGAITGIGIGFEMGHSPDAFLGSGAFGIVFGGGTGVVVGLVSNLTVGPIVARFTDERSGYVSGLTAGKGMTENLTERLSRPTWSLIGLILLAIAVLAALIYLAIQLA